MPDFDTETPQEQRHRPLRVRIQLIAKKLHDLLIANKHRIPLIVNKLRNLQIANRLRALMTTNESRLSLILTIVALLSAISILVAGFLVSDRSDEGFPSILHGPVPQYEVIGSSYEARDCPPSDDGGNILCVYVATKANDAQALARIVQEMIRKGYGEEELLLLWVSFQPPEEPLYPGSYSFATAYAFPEDEAYAKEYFSEEPRREATVIGGVYIFK